MKRDEAEKVIDIILKCDGGCEYCVASLLKLFINNFPQHESRAMMAFKNKFDMSLEDFLNQPHKEILHKGIGDEQ